MRAQILKPSPESLALAAAALSRGEVVGMPTETVYGLAGAAFQPEALARIFDTKERPTFDPLIIHVGLNAKGVFQLERLHLIDGAKLSELARLRATTLIDRFWPGPLTLVLPKHADIPELATSGLDTVALRMPSHRVAQALIAAAGTPLAAPSANRFGRISPTSAEAVAQELGDRIDLILDGGPCQVGVESTVIRVELDGTLTQLRPGGLGRAELETAVGCEIQIAGSSSNPGAAPGPQAAPGMLESHYAPVRPMYLLPAQLAQLEERHWREIRELAAKPTSTNVGLHLAFLLQRGMEGGIQTFLENHLAPGTDFTTLTLSPSGDPHEAARTLFARMRELDASGASMIFAEPCPTGAAERGLGHAISDRLSRACKGRLQS